MGKWSALKFYYKVAREALGIAESPHQPGEAEVRFAEFAIARSKWAIECGPRTDTHLATLASTYGCRLDCYEASPVFAKKLASRLNSHEGVTVHNKGVGSAFSRLRYYYLNQSFLKDVPYPSLGISKKVEVVPLYSCIAAGSSAGPDFVKSDVEGLDLEVFAGLGAWRSGLKYFQLEMTSWDEATYKKLFPTFNFFLLLDNGHPLKETRSEQCFVPTEEVGWDTIQIAMEAGATVNLAGVRQGLETPSF